METLTIYTDGAYSSSRNQGGVGIVFILGDKKIRQYSRMFKNTTNNKMELSAVLIALKSVLTSELRHNIVIKTDSQYVIGCATKGWQRKKNVRLWDKYNEIEKQLIEKGIKFSFEWVHGHQTDKFNNLADKLAVEATHEVEV